MFLRLIIATALLWPVSGWAQGDEAQTVDPEVERTRALIGEGALPPRALEEMQVDLESKRLEARLRELLQRRDLTPAQGPELLSLATRVRDDARARMRRQRSLIEAGAAPANSLADVKNAYDFAAKQYELAQTRAELVRELATFARAEDFLDELEEEDLAYFSEGMAGEWESDIAEIDGVYFEEFGAHLPISAAGATELHESLGYDHTGRYDVALHPDDLEGFFLTTLLDSWGVPYIAFRSAVPGQSTGPHVHIGMPSLRIEPTEVGR